MPRHRSRRPRRLLKWKRLLLLVGVVGLVAASGYGVHAAQVDRQAPTLLAAARTARDAGDGPKAVGFYRQYLAYRKRDAAAYSELAGVYEGLATGNSRLWHNAATAYESALSVDAGRYADRQAAARLYLRTGNWGAARGHLKALLETTDPADPLDAEPYERLAYSLLGRGRAGGPQAAEAAAIEGAAVMDELVKARPADLAARLARARFRMAAGQRAAALDDLRVAYADIPGGAGDDAIVLQQAEVLAETDLPAARKVIDKARAARPDSVPLALGAAEVLRRSGLSAEGVAILREAAARRPDGDPQLLALGDRLIDVNDLDAAADVAKRCERGGDPAAAPYLAGRVATLRGAWPTATNLLRNALPALADRPALALKARLALGGCAAAAGDPDREEEHFAAALKIDPANVAAKLGQAAALAKLGRTAEAVTLYRGMANTTPAAQIALALLKFEETAAKPEGERDWGAFSTLAGPADTLDPALVLPCARALAMQGKPADAEKVLKTALERNKDQPAVWAALAALRSRESREAADATLSEAEEEIGDRTELRVARAEWLAGETGPPDPAAWSRFADGAERFSPAERAALFQALAGLAAAHGHHAEAVSLLQRAAAERPFDLALRLTLLDMAVRARNLPAADAALAEIRTLDGPDGPVATVAGFARDIAAGTPPTADHLAGWKSRIDAALASRGSWGRLHQVAGDVAALERRPTAALTHYQKAIDRREFAAPLVRRTIDLLLDADRTAEALKLMARTDVRAAIGPSIGKSFDLIRASMIPTEDRAAAMALARDPDRAVSPNVRDQLARADIFGFDGQIPPALDALRRAKSLDDVSPAVRVAVVRFLMAAGEPGGAVAQMQEAERRWADPAVRFEDPTTVPVTLGTCKELVGDVAGAAAEFAKVTALTPNDPAAWQRRFDLLRRAGNTTEAEKIAAEAAASSTAEVAVWGRRTQALAILDSPDGFKDERRAVAFALLDRNLKDGGNRPDDIRAKGFIILADPFRRAEGMAMVTRGGGPAPFTLEQHARLAAVLALAGETESAAKHLAEATANGWHADPDHLAKLVGLKLALGDLPAARLVANRLKLIAPAVWATAVTDARVLDAEGQRKSALERLQSHPTAKSQPQVLARALEEIGAAAEAEAEYRKAGPVPLAEFLLRQRRFDDAATLIRSAPPGDADALAVQARLAEERGETDAALDRWSEAVNHSRPERKAERLVALATLMALAHPERAKEALDRANEAAALVGPRGDVLEARAAARAALKDYDGALNDLTAAAGVEPRPRFFFRIARIHAATKKIDARNRAAARALDAGLTPNDLRPIERPVFEKLGDWK